MVYIQNSNPKRPGRKILKRIYAYISRILRKLFQSPSKAVMMLIIMALSLHIVTKNWNSTTGIVSIFKPTPDLYLMDEAAKYVSDPRQFQNSVRTAAMQIGIPPEWLMVVMFLESRFKAEVKNYKGSGAVGLIQFMPSTAKSLGTTSEFLAQMPAHVQIEYVVNYFKETMKRREFQEKPIPGITSLTEAYLTILYPKAIGKDYCFNLYVYPSIEYTKNSGLDSNKDHGVSVSDIDQMLKHRFKTAYVLDPIVAVE